MSESVPEPEKVPVRPAATVMLVDDRPGYEVFMMERHANPVFAGGMWVFPGGRVDDDDDADHFQAISIHRSDAEASELMGLSKGGLAYYVAAIREAFEEAGILLALNRDSHTPLDLTDDERAARFAAHRDALNAGETSLIDIVNAENLILDVGAMHYVARWITPMGPPRRFDARFFVAPIPPLQTPVHDDGELVHSEWLAPSDILEREEKDEMVLMSPTLRMVRNLALFDSASQVIESAQANMPDHEARVHPESRVIVMPGEPGYEEGLTDVETGWVRLRPK